MKKTFWKYIVLQDGEIVNQGILEEPVEIDVEKIFPKANSSSDRCLYEMQKYADMHLKEYNYEFRHKEIEIDFSDLEDVIE